MLIVKLKPRLLFLLFIFFSFSLIAQNSGDWSRLPSPTNDILRKLFFVDGNNGWASGLTGTIVHTSDAGASWVLQNSTVTTPIVDIFFIDNSLGWALTYPQVPPFGTTILKTNDGGIHWLPDSIFFENEIMSTIYFFDNLTGLIGGNGIKKTTDGGISWFNTSTDSGIVSNLPVYDFNFYNNSFGYACGGRLDVAGVIWRTTDGGNNWASFGLSPDQIFDVFISDSLNVISLSGDPEGIYPLGIVKSTNGGVSWDFTEIPLYGLSFALDFTSTNNGWSASGYKFLRTTDAGLTWFEEPTPDSINIYDLQFVDENIGFACGENGALLKYFHTTEVSESNDLVSSFMLEQNYPNPFNPKTIIPWRSPSSGLNILKVFDVLGNEVATLVNEYRQAGEYEVEFNPFINKTYSASGVFFYQLQVGNYIETKKMILIK